MRDHAVRERLRRDLQIWASRPNILFVNELDLGGLVRVDTAAAKGALWGYEIKSAQDTLRRLLTQVEIYSKVLDYAALVVAERHHEHAVDLLPDWWHVYVATDTADGVVLAEAHKGTGNADVDLLQPLNSCGVTRRWRSWSSAAGTGVCDPSRAALHPAHRVGARAVRRPTAGRADHGHGRSVLRVAGAQTAPRSRPRLGRLGVIVGVPDPTGDSCGLVEQATGFVLPRVC